MTPPTVLGDRYALEEVIGRGGMADVYRATDQVLGREVAVKVLRESEPEESDRARFMSEARTLARLNHPHLVTVLDAGTTGERPYLVMELVPGVTLAEACSRGPVPPVRVAEVGVQVADALAYVHENGIVHRDVKPGNVLLRDDRRALLADFGIARLVGETSHHTRTGTTIGSPAYFSPEQVQGLPVTPASDLYSLGLVLLEALTAERAYTGTPTEAAIARLSRPPQVPDWLPAGWVRLLRELTDSEPSRRPSAAQAAERLRSLASGADADATQALAASTRVMTTAGAVPPVPPPEPRRRERAAAAPVPPEQAAQDAEQSRRFWLLALGLVAVIALVVIVMAIIDRAGAGGGDEPAQDTPTQAPTRPEQTTHAPEPAPTTQAPAPAPTTAPPTTQPPSEDEPDEEEPEEGPVGEARQQLEKQQKSFEKLAERLEKRAEKARERLER